MVKKGAKIVFIYRNLKSVATSYYFHHTRDDVYDYKSTFDRYLIRFLDGLGEFEILYIGQRLVVIVV